MDQCALDDCNGRVVGRGWCRKHYLRWYRHGTPEGRPTHSPCRIEGCERAPASIYADICEMHRTRIRRHGDPDTVIGHRRQSHITYQSAHQRLSADRGRADSRTCVDCGLRAAHWSYDHQDPDPLISSDGLPYSLDQSRYHPRCLSCHGTFDKGRHKRIPRGQDGAT